MDVLREIEAQGERYGHSQVGQGRRVLVEYVSANPTGPLHVGHGRGAAVGQALVRLLCATGHDVVSEYYINDAGRQMKLLGLSVLARYREACGQTVSFPEDGYHGGYIRTVAEHVKAEQGAALLSFPLLMRNNGVGSSRIVNYWHSFVRIWRCSGSPLSPGSVKPRCCRPAPWSRY